ncbi:hypothetical protein D0Z00_002734 [Geotrichum galactomycetum]|uniref:Uncharacterized protein n=1 Tax=Geotrichum galactomycetum TaxID=27317 RepID=A0ACB6V373_9ASCO|nr:hypothetical protein D0Z00_002734 [Geotrichum candidum]
MDEAAKFRTSKRVRARTDEKPELEDVDMTEDENFFTQIDSFLQLCGMSFESIVPVFMNEDGADPEIFVTDFKTIVQNWDEEHGEILSKLKIDITDKTVSKKPILSQLIDNAGTVDKPVSFRPTTLESSQVSKDFVDLANNNKFHIQELRIKLVRRILTPQHSSLSPFFTDLLPLEAIDILKKTVDQCEPQLGSVSRSIVSSGIYVYNEIFIVQSILELVADSYLQAKAGLRSPDLHSKQALKDMELVRSTCPARYTWWTRTFGDLVEVYKGDFSDLNILLLRHEWTNLLIQQADCEESWDNLEEFLAFEQDIIAIDEKVSVTYMNFLNIPVLSISSLRTLTAKLKAMSTLSKIFVENNEQEQSEDDKKAITNSRISLLECVLMPDYNHDQTLNEYQTISDYFVNAPLKLKAKFWSILLADYFAIGENHKSLNGFLKLLSDNISEFTSKSFESKSDQERTTILIRSIYTCHDFVGKIVSMLKSDDTLLQNFSRSQLNIYFSAVIQLLRTLHIFILFEDAVIHNALHASTHSSWEAFSTLLKELIVSALLCLNIAIREMPSDWYNHYLKGKCLHKLKAEPTEVMDSFVTSILLCPEKPGSHGEYILEPHYKLVSRIYKYLKAGQITSEVALDYLGRTQYHDEKTIVPLGDNSENDRIYGICISTLAKIRANDKRKTQHRPTYRIAKIYDDCGELYKAKEEIGVFFQIKSNSKTPIHIWKTDFERPGQHFLYVKQYVTYFITVLERTNDLNIFGIISKSLRKFVSGIMDHSQVWELLCTAVSRVLKEQLSIPPKYNDNVIPRLVFDEFEKNNQKMLQHVEKNEELHPLIKYLHYTAEVRRLNNGFGSTAALDDIFVAIYLTIYSDFVKNIFVKEEELAAKQKAAEEEQRELKLKVPVPVQPSTKISVMDLLSQPATPVSKPSSPATPAPAAEQSAKPGTQAGKIRVTRRDIISRSLGLLRVALPKIVKGDNAKIPNTPPSVAGGSAAAAATSALDPSATATNSTVTNNNDNSNGDTTNGNGNTNGTESNSSHNKSFDHEEAETVPSTPNPDSDIIIISPSKEEQSKPDQPLPPPPQEEPKLEPKPETPAPPRKRSEWLSTIL